MHPTPPPRTPRHRHADTHAPGGRRRALGGLAALVAAGLGGCALPALQPLPALPAGASADPEAAELLLDSARAHGLAGWQAVSDLNVSYRGEWGLLLDTLQPELVDAAFRQRSEERLLPAAGLIAQQHRGPGGRKQVLRRGGSAGLVATEGGTVQVRFNGQASDDPARLDAAALVADGYRLFLLGPLALQGRDGLGLALDGEERIDERLCDRLRVRLAPGLGRSDADTLLLFIDRHERLMRRVRFSLEGLASTRGAIAEVDTFGFIERHGVRWPTRFHERLLRPIPGLPVHDWRLTGLDINRGWSADEVGEDAWRGRAAAPATPI